MALLELTRERTLKLKPLAHLLSLQALECFDQFLLIPHLLQILPCAPSTTSSTILIYLLLALHTSLCYHILSICMYMHECSILPFIRSFCSSNFFLMCCLLFLTGDKQRASFCQSVLYVSCVEYFMCLVWFFKVSPKTFTTVYKPFQNLCSFFHSPRGYVATPCHPPCTVYAVHVPCTFLSYICLCLCWRSAISTNSQAQMHSAILANPMNCLSCFWFDGVGQLRTHSIFVWSVCTPSLDTT